MVRPTPPPPAPPVQSGPQWNLDYTAAELSFRQWWWAGVTSRHPGLSLRQYQAVTGLSVNTLRKYHIPKGSV